MVGPGARESRDFQGNRECRDRKDVRDNLELKDVRESVEFREKEAIEESKGWSGPGVPKAPMARMATTVRTA